MIWKKSPPPEPTPLDAFEQGWTPTLLASIFDSRGDRNGVKTWEIMTHLHGIKLAVNNAEILRYGYGMTFVSDHAAKQSEDICC